MQCAKCYLYKVCTLSRVFAGDEAKLESNKVKRKILGEDEGQ